VADRWLGRRRAVVLGGLIMAAGHFMMAFEPLLYGALATIAIGNGLFLPSLPSQIDSLYAHDDPRRHSAYNVYYVGINLGAFLAPLVVGTLGEAISFHLGFSVAGLGMLVGLVTYLTGSRYLPPDPGPRRRIAVEPEPGETPREGLVRRFVLLGAIALAVVVFRGAYEQIGNTLALWADADVDRHAGGGFVIPVTWFQSLNPMLVFLLTPLYVARWTRLAKRGREPSSVVKMVMGAGVIGGSYLLIAAVSWWTGRSGGQVNWLWLAFFNVVMTAGELFILPVGLGLFGRLAPNGLRATTIAFWFSAGFFGNLLAGWLGGFWSRLDNAEFFVVIGAVALLAAILLRLLASPARAVERAT
jgi:POT family proton-dependent oligopeptide transporter